MPSSHHTTVNRVFLLGKLLHAPKFGQPPAGGERYCFFQLETRQDKNAPQTHSILAMGERNHWLESLTNGIFIYVEGRLVHRKRPGEAYLSSFVQARHIQSIVNNPPHDQAAINQARNTIRRLFSET